MGNKNGSTGSLRLGVQAKQPAREVPIVSLIPEGRSSEGWQIGGAESFAVDVPGRGVIPVWP